MRNKAFLLSPFFLSISLGVICWLLVFAIFPIEIVFPISSQVALYILLSYVSIITGYLIVPKVTSSKLSNQTKIGAPMIKILILVVLLSFLIRYIDLFVFRGVRIGYPIAQNRMLIDANPPKFIFILVSVTRYLFFVPILFLFHSKIKSKKLLIFCLLLFLLPFIEGVVRGSRNSFFYPSILLIFSLLYFKKIKFKKLHLGVLLLVFSVLFVMATGILKKREMIKKHDYKSLTTDAIYNDFLKPKKSILEKIHRLENIKTKQLLISGLQTGQYYTHGVFEFDNLMKTYHKNDSLNFQFGKYNFLNFIKFANKLGITHLDLSKIKKANPRGYSFTTFFGGLYIDFGWYGLVFMFFFGAFQKILFNKVNQKKPQYLPLLLFFIFTNFFMLTFNFFRNTGVSILTVNIVFIICVSVYNRILARVKD